jgi:hypothetical protein
VAGGFGDDLELATPTAQLDHRLVDDRPGVECDRPPVDVRRFEVVQREAEAAKVVAAKRRSEVEPACEL